MGAAVGNVAGDAVVVGDGVGTGTGANVGASFGAGIGVSVVGAGMGAAVEVSAGVDVVEVSIGSAVGAGLGAAAVVEAGIGSSVGRGVESDIGTGVGTGVQASVGACVSTGTWPDGSSASTVQSSTFSAVWHAPFPQPFGAEGHGKLRPPSIGGQHDRPLHHLPLPGQIAPAPTLHLDGSGSVGTAVAAVVVPETVLGSADCSVVDAGVGSNTGCSRRRC